MTKVTSQPQFLPVVGPGKKIWQGGGDLLQSFLNEPQLGINELMHIRHISLTNYRNYGRLELDLPSGPVLLHGNNAQGKTNLLEAIYYLATTRSPHADQDQQLLNWDADLAGEPVVVSRLVANVISQDEERHLEIRLIKEQRQGQASFRREALVNRRKVRLMDFLGHLRVVLFLPEDMQLITGAPSQRRRYLDITLCQTDPIYCRTLSKYNKLLEQRNALLRQLAEGNGSRDLLPIYDEKLVNLGGLIMMRRAAFCQAMGREAQRIHYEKLTDGLESMRLRYLPRLVGNGARRPEETEELAELGEWLQKAGLTEQNVCARFAKELQSSLPQDIARGVSNVGPHRDDWQIDVNGRNLNVYGSRGQQRSAILALKMAEIQYMKQTTQEMPVLLLDEVVAELDEQRRALLLHFVKGAAQTLLTATDPGMFTTDFLREATILLVRNGRIQPSATMKETIP